MVFEALSDRLAAALRRFSGRGRLTKEDVEVGLREVRTVRLFLVMHKTVAGRGWRAGARSECPVRERAMTPDH